MTENTVHKAANRGVAWVPSPGVQAAAYACPCDEILYGGAAGGGKSDWLLATGLLHAAQWPGARVLVLRADLTDMADLTDRMHALVRGLGARHNGTTRRWTLKNGSVIEFGFTSRGVDRYMGREFTALLIDELTLSVPDLATYQMLRGRLRSPRGIPTITRCTTNPRGPYLAWVRERFIDGAAPGSVVTDAMGRTRTFIPASLADNPYLGGLAGSYAAALADLPERERKALLLGDWYAFNGAVFRVAKGRGLVTLDDARKAWGGDDPPKWWPRFRGYDWGYASPAGVVWVAVAPDGAMWVYREWYIAASPGVGLRMTTREQGERIAKIERDAGEQGVIGIADPACWNKAQGAANGAPGSSVIDELQAGGTWNWRRGDNRRVEGWSQILTRLEFRGLHIVLQSCPHVLRTLAAIESDPRHPEDCRSDGDDHMPDALRYLCMSRPWGRSSDPSDVDPWRAARDRREQAVRKTALWGRS